VQHFETDPSTSIDALAPRFDALGLSDIAARLRALSEPEPLTSTSASDQPFPALPAEFGPADVLSVEAARVALGLRSHALVTSLIEVGKLQAYWCDDQVVLTRESVERYASSPVVGTQRRVEEEVLSILEAVGDL
jgi:hypothetical protein